MLRNYPTDFDHLCTIRRALVWIGADLNFILIGPLQVDQIGQKLLKAAILKVAAVPMLRNYWTDFKNLYTIRCALVWIGAVLNFILIGPL